MKYSVKKYSIIEYLKEGKKKYGFFYKRENDFIILVPFDELDLKKRDKIYIDIKKTNYYE